MARQIPIERNRFFLDASGQPARRGNLFDTLYANAGPTASSNSARNEHNHDLTRFLRRKQLLRLRDIDAFPSIYKSSSQILFVV